MLITKITKWSLSPITIIIALIVSILLGYHFPLFSLQLQPLGNMFLELFQICIIPILITAIPSGLAKVLSNRKNARIFYQLIIVLVVTSIVVVFMGIVIAKLFHFGYLSPDNRAQLGDLILNTKVSVDHSTANNFGFVGFIANFFNQNIFTAFTQNKILAILLFSILLGISLGTSHHENKKIVIQTLQGLFYSILRIIHGITYLLPIGIICIIAPETANLGFTEISIALSLLLAIYILGLLLLAINLIILGKLLKSPWYSILFQFRRMLMLAFVTGSTYASFPLGIQILEDQYKITKDKTNLIFPITVILSPVAMMLFTSMALIFGMTLYHIPLSLSKVIIIYIGSIAISIITGGVPAIAGFTVFAIALQPLGVPALPVIVALTAIGALVDPIVTLVNVIINVSQVVYIVKKQHLTSGFEELVQSPKSTLSQLKAPK